MAYSVVVSKYLIDGKYQHFQYAYEKAFEQSEEEPLSDNEQYMHIKELQFVLKNVRELIQIQLYQNYARADRVSTKGRELNGDHSTLPGDRKCVDQKQLSQEIVQLDLTLQSIQNYILKRLEAAAESGACLPRIVTLCHQYHFLPREAELFHLLTIVQGSHNSCVLNNLIEEDYLRRMTGLKRLAGLADVDIELFVDPERSHMKETIILVDEENGVPYNLKVNNAAVQLLYGRRVRSDDLLKISQTSLESIVMGEGGDRTKKRRREEGEEDGTELGEEIEEAGDGEGAEGMYSPQSHTGIVASSRPPKPIKLMRVNSWGPSSIKGSLSPHSTPFLRLGKRKLISSTSPDLSTPLLTLPASKSIEDDHLSAESPSIVPSNNNILLDPELSHALQPYSAGEQLEYLEDCFQWIALMIKGNAAKLKDDLKKEGTSSRYNNNWGEGVGDMKHSKRELQAKILLQEKKIAQRLERTKDKVLPVPRLEQIVEKFGLDTFEKGVILLLIGKTVSPIVRTLLETLDTSSGHTIDDHITVAQALSILCQSFHTQIYARKYFYQNSRLLTNAIISLSKPRWHHGSGDLTENRVVLDRRMLDYLVGLDSEINELVEGSDLYTPYTPLASLVLAPETKTLLLSQCRAYDLFLQFKKHQKLQHKAQNSTAPSTPLLRSYGHALVILLCGIPGTGKTMTVNALATELQKKVLLCDFNSLINKKESSSSDLEVDLKGLFRESKLNNAVLFFDECEHIFKNRNYSSDRLINSLLVEMEKHEGIVFLATNRAYDLDEAMHRRITMVIEYTLPDKYRRKVIWDNLLGEMTTPRVEAKEGMEIDSNSKKDESDLSSSHVHTDVAIALASTIPTRIFISPQVDTSILAQKYSLTGGFIKNAVLSAILMALSRVNNNTNHDSISDQNAPTISQQDLITACQLQMRGNLYQKTFEHKVPSPQQTLAGLYGNSSDLQTLQKVIKYEQTREKVYGSWSVFTTEGSVGAAAGTSAGIEASSTSSSSSVIQQDKLTEKANIVLLAGVHGSGKFTIVESVANTLGIKALKVLHIGDFLSSTLYELTEIFKILIKDAQIVDAAIVLQGFEHLLVDPEAGAGAGSGGEKLQVTLSRVLELLYEFHGLVFLCANIDNPQDIILKRDFSSRLFAFLRLSLPSGAVRAKMWKALLPAKAPLGKDLDFIALGRRFDLYPGDIQGAIAFACAEVAAKGPEAVVVQKDLIAAGEYMISKCKGEHGDMISKLFT